MIVPAGSGVFVGTTSESHCEMYQILLMQSVGSTSRNFQSSSTLHLNQLTGKIRGIYSL